MKGVTRAERRGKEEGRKASLTSIFPPFVLRRDASSVVKGKIRGIGRERKSALCLIDLISRTSSTYCPLSRLNDRSQIEALDLPPICRSGERPTDRPTDRPEIWRSENEAFAAAPQWKDFKKFRQAELARDLGKRGKRALSLSPSFLHPPNGK